MLDLLLAGDGPLTVLAVGAHSDDVELGCGGTLLQLKDSGRSRLNLVVLSATPSRAAEARAAGAALGAHDVDVLDLPDGRFPGHWSVVKDALEAVAARLTPDLVLGPRTDDAHQDHRVLAEVLPTVFRDALLLGYEIPKLDGDRGRCSVYVPLADGVVGRKWDLLDGSFVSQRGRHWWDHDVVAGLARLRGVECRSPAAEGFTCSRAVLRVAR